LVVEPLFWVWGGGTEGVESVFLKGGGDGWLRVGGVV